MEILVVKMARKSHEEMITTISEAVGMYQHHQHLELELNVLHFRHRIGSP